ncbi:hypothetical protein GCM10010271_03710 [Streptomyces kurssanovii]|nr:hypothetical protein GCM10010271_03710 [Streptomyces kurssanovii]
MWLKVIIRALDAEQACGRPPDVVESRSATRHGSLVGGFHMAVDVHLRTCALEAVVDVTGRLERRRIHEETADRFGHDRGGMDTQ